MFLFYLTLLPYVYSLCYPNLEPLKLQPLQYNGSWFLVAEKSTSNNFPHGSNTTSSMLRLLVQPDNSSLSLLEYHSINDTCTPAVHGNLTKFKDGYSLRIAMGEVIHEAYVIPIYHGYSGEKNEEMNLALYGCQNEHPDGGCPKGDEFVLIMSNSRHPQTLQLFKSAKIIEDNGCLDILLFRTFNTYTNCGDDVVDEDQKLEHAAIDENNEFVDVECKVENFKPANTKINNFFDEPRILTVVAYIDPALTGEQIAHISCLYSSKSNAVCEWIRKDICFKTNLTQRVSYQRVDISTTILRKNGTSQLIDWSGDVLWENGDEYISMTCTAVDDDGACDSVRVYVWSDEDHMDQPTIREIYRQLQAVCIDPTDLIFLNTFHECVESSLTPRNELSCTTDKGFSPQFSSMLEGVWYGVADLNSDPKVFLQSAVLYFKKVESKDRHLYNVTYYVQRESDGWCIGPGNGIVNITNDGVMKLDIEYKYTMINYSKTLKFNYTILYLDNQRSVLYWCYKKNANGTCIQQDITVLMRGRHFSHNDVSMITPYLESVCVEVKDLRWFDLHSQCGFELSSSSYLRRDLVTLSHYNVLDILTNVQEPKCLFGQVKGVRADLFSLERAGTWYLTSRMDEMAMDTFAMVGRIFAVSNSSAVLRLFQSAALPGEPRTCFTRVFTIHEVEKDDNYFYELHFEATTKNSTTMIFQFLFFNKHVGVMYSCLRNDEEGQCIEKAIYVISRHESIDHAELTVLEKVSKSVCVEPNLLWHAAVAEECVVGHHRLKPPPCSSIDVANSEAEWINLNSTDIEEAYGQVVYHVVASSSKISKPFSLKFDGTRMQKITEESTGCLSFPVEVRFSGRNRLLFRLPDEIVLVHPAAVKSNLYLREAQLSGILPCLSFTNFGTSNCSLLETPMCQGSTSSETAIEDGTWYLFASDPYYVLNSRCEIQSETTTEYSFKCISESWIGECERPTKGTLVLSDGSHFQANFDQEKMAIRPGRSEIFSRGNISVTSDRILMWNDGDLLGRSYSIWLRKSTDWNEKRRSEMAAFCVWPLPSQMRDMNMLC